MKYKMSGSFFCISTTINLMSVWYAVFSDYNWNCPSICEISIHEIRFYLEFRNRFVYGNNVVQCDAWDLCDRKIYCKWTIFPTQNTYNTFNESYPCMKWKSSVHICSNRVFGLIYNNPYEVGLFKKKIYKNFAHYKWHTFDIIKNKIVCRITYKLILLFHDMAFLEWKWSSQ